MGVVVINNTAKLKPFNDKVKFLQWQLLTLVLTFFKLFFIHVLWIRNFVVCLHHRNEAVPNKHQKIMKNQFENRKANFVEEITYTIVMVYKGSSYTEKLTFKELFFYNEDKEDRELVFALNEEFEDILKMKQGDQMPVRVVRDLDEYGVIERTH